MQYHIVGKNIDVTDGLKETLTTKLHQLFKSFEPVTHVDAAFYLEHHEQVVEVSARYHAHEIHASAKSADMYQSIDQVIDKLSAQLVKHKEKLIESHR